MASRKEILDKIGALVEDLDRIAEEEQAAGIGAAREQIDRLTAELEEVRARADELLAAKQGLEKELELSERRIESLVQKLKEARQAAADAVEESQKTMRRQLEALQEECDEARGELDRERSVRKRLEKGAAADDKRLNELEKALAGKSRPATGDDDDGRETGRLQSALDQALARLGEEQRARESIEEELAEAHALIEGLEKAVKNSRAAGEAAADAGTNRLTERLAAAEAREGQAQQENERLSAACAAADKRVAELEAALKKGVAAAGKPDSEGRSARPPADRLLPHELRPAPKPGATFRPDWELQGLPCKSADQVVHAWNSMFNVQLSLEGYPSQYCTAFLVVLKQGKSKQLYLVFNLKMSKHILVCVPARVPADEAALEKAIAEGLKYLQMSGFELEKTVPDEVPRLLESYFVKG